MDEAKEFLIKAYTALARWNDALYPGTWPVIVIEIIATVVVVMVAHRLGLSTLRRMAARLPVTRRLLAYGSSSGRAVLVFYVVLLILHDAPDRLAGIAMARRVDLLALVLAATWLGVRCVRAVADTIVELHPADTVTNTQARRIQTQARVLAQSFSALIILLGLGLAFSTMPVMRQIGTTFLASAGMAGLVVGFAAKPVLGNLLAGMQLALTQAIRLGDVVIVEQEWGTIEEITGTYVVVRIWDERRLVIPLQWFIEHPFQNWTRNQTAILGTVHVWTDFGMPVGAIRREAERICSNAPDWNRVLCVTHVTDSNERAMQLRILVSASDASQCWELRCRVREGIVDFIQREYPRFLPRVRTDLDAADLVARAPRAA
ncbi:MAG: mechanosensitive ion channel [Herminiimonas sp.]|nr:mechanosensitive ion channel [Herminiimonas sp.]